MAMPNVPDEIKEYISQAFFQSTQWKLPNGESSINSTSVNLATVGVIGGGTMGRNIAISLCLAGFQTILVEIDEKALSICRHELGVTIEREVSLKRFREREIALCNSSALTLTTDFQQLDKADLVIEAVFENMSLKKEILKKLDGICRKNCILGTNTSSLNIDEMSSVLSNPSRLVGIHFFNPAHVIRMVEVVYGLKTSGEAVATAFEACKRMKKVAILVGNCPSFVFNRLLAVYLNQAHKLMLHYGLSPQSIDSIVLSFGFVMGPITMHDMNGIDVGAKVKSENNIELNELEMELLRLNRLGRKNGKGFYCYDEVTRKKSSDMIIDRLIERVSKGKKRNIQLFCDSDVMDFLLFPMVNEGFLCIEEGMIEEEKLIDIMFILGFGWPPKTGGPMNWGRGQGLKKICQRIQHWYSLEPEDRTYKLSELLVRKSRYGAKL